MTSERIGWLAGSVGTLAVVAAAANRWYGLDRPEYALFVAEGPINVHIAEDPSSAQSLKQQFDLRIVNAGRKPVALASVRASCSCTVAGEISAAPIAPGDDVSIPLQLQFPAFGSKLAHLTLFARNDQARPLDVILRMHGPQISAPFVRSIHKPMQFVTESPGELVDHEFAVETVEQRGDNVWLQAMTSTYENSNAEPVLVNVLKEIPAADIVERRYVFQLRFVGPTKPHEVLAFALQPVTASPPVRPSSSQWVRCHMIPPPAAIAQAD